MIIFRLLGLRVQLFHQDLKTRSNDFIDHTFPQSLLTQSLILIAWSTRFQRIVRLPATSRGLLDLVPPCFHSLPLGHFSFSDKSFSPCTRRLPMSLVPLEWSGPWDCFPPWAPKVPLFPFLQRCSPRKSACSLSGPFPTFTSTSDSVLGFHNITMVSESLVPRALTVPGLLSPSLR